MPTRITHYLHDSVVAPDSPPALGTSFSTADVHAHDLGADLPAFQSARNYYGIVTGIHVRVTDIVTAASITIRLCADPEGDFTLVPDVTADLATGLTTTDSGCIAVSVGIPIYQILGGPGNSTVYLFAHVDAGSANFAQSCVTWTE